MIKTSTRPFNSLHTEIVKSSDTAEDLSEEEQSFYTFIKPDLNKINLKPNPALIDKILNYSRSL
jgi:hypothetical protein